MPYITIKMLSGRDEKKKEKLISNVTDAVADALEIQKDSIVIFIEEIEKNHLGIGGKQKQ